MTPEQQLLASPHHSMSSLSFEFIVEGVLLFTVGSLGVLANTAAIVWFAKKQQHTFYRCRYH